jgi:hypothetical protein
MVRWVGYVDPMGEKINAVRDLVGKPERKRLLGRSRRRREDNIKLVLRKKDGMEWTGSSDSGCGAVADFCEHDIKFSEFLKCREILE